MAAVSELQKTRVKWAWIFITPSLVTIFLVAGFPLLQTIRYSFTNVTLDSLDEYEFVGFANYVQLFADPLWWSAIWVTIKFTMFSVGLETALGLIVALFLHHNFKGRGMLRVAVLVPWAIPTVVSSQIWTWLYHDQYGVINHFLGVFQQMFAMLGLSDGVFEPIAFMGNPDLILPTIIAVDVWKTIPFMALLLLAGLGTIPGSLYEAAKIDGATPVQTFFKVTLPLLRPTLLIALIFRSLDALRVFDIIYVMQGSNERASSMAIYARQQMIDFQEIGLGSTASVAIFVVISLFVFLYMVVLKPDFNK